MYGTDTDPSLDLGTRVRSDGSGSTAALDFGPPVFPKLELWTFGFSIGFEFAFAASGEASSVVGAVGSEVDRSYAYDEDRVMDACARVRRAL